MAEVLKNSLFQLQEQGYLTLQIPEIALYIGTPPTEKEATDSVPGEWLMRVHSSCTRPAIPTERSSFLHWSRAGYEANKEEMKKRFGTKGEPRGTWEEFEAHAEAHYASLKAGAAREIARCEKRAAALKAVVEELKL